MFAKTPLGKAVIRSVALAAAALVLWSVLARPSGAHGPRTLYRVRPSDTLWAIAAARYGGDVREAVWRIEQANHLAGATIVPGERLNAKAQPMIDYLKMFKASFNAFPGFEVEIQGVYKEIDASGRVRLYTYVVSE